MIFRRVVLVLSLLPLVTACLMAQDNEPGVPDSGLTVRGVVLSVSDHKPIVGATVGLFLSHRTTTTDDQGHFEFSGVPFGKNEQLSARKDGYLCGLLHSGPLPHCTQGVDDAMNQQEMKSKDIAEARQVLKAGVVDVTMTLMPAAEISGRIVNQTGEPVPKIHVVLLYREINDGLYQWNGRGGSAETDANGDYRFRNLEPGTYLLRTGILTGPWAPMSTSPGYAAVWYPNAATQQDAQPVVLAAGTERTVSLTVAAKPLHLINIPFEWNRPDAIGTVGYGLSSDQTTDSLQATILYASGHLFQASVPNGTFNFTVTIYPHTDVRTGVVTPWSDGTTQPFLGHSQFSVDDRTISAPAIPLQQPIDIAVHVRAELTQQDKRKAAVSHYEVYYAPSAAFRLEGNGRRFNNQLSWSATKPAAELVFKDVGPGSYTLRAVAMQGAYIASLTCGGVNLLRDPLVVGPGIPSCSIEALVRDDVASLSVQLTPQARASMDAAHVRGSIALLIPVEGSVQPPVSSLVLWGSESRPFSVAPGTYLAVLSDGRNLAWREPEVRKQLMAAGKVVTLKPGEAQTVLVDWSPAFNNPQSSYPVGSLGTLGP